MVSDAIAKYQQQLLDQAARIYHRTPIGQATVEAFRAVPRHAFVKRYRGWGSPNWHEVSAANLLEHLATLYADRPLILFGENDDDVPSTNSQPSFVLRLIDLLQLQPGQTVLELGAGSGWTAALIAHLVGPSGRVYSLEIIPEVARTAAENVRALAIANLEIIAADGGDGHATGAPYDRVIFTAGTYDLPRAYYGQIKDGGLLLAVIKVEGGGDTLVLLRKAGDHFESVDSSPAGFVPLTGEYQVTGLEPSALETMPEWASLQSREISRRPFWWGGKSGSPLGGPWRTQAIRSFLSIVEPSFRAFKNPGTDGHAPEEHFFGLRDRENGSLVLARDDLLIAYGNRAAEEQLWRRIREWVDLGMPSAASFLLKIYPRGYAVPARERQWIVDRPESQFVWSLEA